MKTNQDMMDPPAGKSIIGASTVEPNKLEKAMMVGLDIDRIKDTAECLFTLNNRQYGPIAGAYVVVCIEEGKLWCVGQLNADRAKPVILFEDKVFDSPELAQAEAEAIKLARGETTPCRNH